MTGQGAHVARPIRVLHCDDYEPFVALVRFWLDEHPDLEHVGAAQDRASALAAIEGAQPDVVLLDTMIRGQDRLLVADVRGAAPRARILVYSGYPPEVAERMVDAGADGYMEKGDDEADLVAAIRRLAAG